jgi:hypothetical protein
MVNADRKLNEMKEVKFLKHWHLKHLGFFALTMIFLFASCSSKKKKM